MKLIARRITNSTPSSYHQLISVKSNNRSYALLLTDSCVNRPLICAAMTHYAKVPKIGVQLVERLVASSCNPHVLAIASLPVLRRKSSLHTEGPLVQLLPLYTGSLPLQTDTAGVHGWRTAEIRLQRKPSTSYSPQEALSPKNALHLEMYSPSRLVAVESAGRPICFRRITGTLRYKALHLTYTDRS